MSMFLLLLQIGGVSVNAKALDPHFCCGIILGILCLSERKVIVLCFHLIYFFPSSIMKNNDTFRCWHFRKLRWYVVDYKWWKLNESYFLIIALNWLFSQSGVGPVDWAWTFYPSVILWLPQVMWNDFNCLAFWNPEFRELIQLEFSHCTYMQEFVPVKRWRIVIFWHTASQAWQLKPQTVFMMQGSRKWGF